MDVGGRKRLELVFEDTENTEENIMEDIKTDLIIGAAIEVHRILGPGLLENIYEQALCYEFEIRGIKYKRQLNIEVLYKGKIITGQRLDLLAENEIIIEVKSLLKIPDVAIAQILSYLKVTRLKRGLIINFGGKRLTNGIKRVSL